jgi:hypothetical protein
MHILKESNLENSIVTGNKSRLVIDTMSEVFDLLKPYANEVFWDFGSMTLHPGSTYVIGRQHLMDNKDRIRTAAETGQYTMIFANSAEGSWTLESQIKQLGIDDLVREEKLLLIGGAEVDPQYPCLTHEYFLTTILGYPENIQAQQKTDLIFSSHKKPYKFLFLNGRARPHRKYLYEKLTRRGTLDHALWTMLDAKPTVVRSFTFSEDAINVMATHSKLQRLPDYYEVDRYRNPTFGPIVPDRSFLKQELFRLEWGEIYLEPAPYIDTYFSLITETVCAESTLSFRTEKTAKPLAMGHPFIVATTPGFYKDLHNLGFRTFANVIDESFDNIDNAQQRMDRIIDIVHDLCQQDLVSFLSSCHETCKYNQQHLRELREKVNLEFPQRFFQFAQRYQK